MQTQHRRAIMILLAASAAIRCIVALRPLEYIDGLTIPDDAYISLTIAKNISLGLGPLYGFEHTNGFQPLYVFFVAPVFLLFPHDLFAPVRIALFLLILFDTITLYFLYRHVAALTKSILAPVLVSVAWLCNPYCINTSLNGLETSISALFVMATLYYYHIITTRENNLLPFKECFLLGILLGFAFLARVDNGFLALSIVLVFLWQNRLQSYVPLTQRLLIILTAIGLVALPWLFYSYSYTGDFYPVSGRAVRLLSLGHNPTFQDHYIPMLMEAAVVLAKKNWVTIGLLGLITLLLLVQGLVIKNRIMMICTRLAPAMLFSLMLVGAYAFYIFTPWFFPRYFFPVAMILLLASGLWIDLFFETLKKKKQLVAFAGIFFLLIVTLNVTHKHFKELLFSTDRTSLGYMNLGLWAKEEFPDGTIIGAPQSGALGYFAPNLRLINLDGVVNKSAFESLVQQRCMEYVRNTGIKYIVTWKSNLDYIKENSGDYKEGDLSLIKKIEGFKSLRWDWYVMKVNYDRKQQ